MADKQQIATNDSLEFKIGDRKYEIIIVCEPDGASIKGLALLKKCKELWANTGREDYEFFLSHQVEIPTKLQGIILVFPQHLVEGLTVALSEEADIEDVLSNGIVSSGVWCLLWDDEKWDQHPFLLSPESSLYGDEFYKNCRIVRRCP